MSVRNEKEQSTEPFYRREFKQEEFLLEETSNLASEEPYINEPFQFFLLGFIGLLFVGCLGILLLDLLLPRFRENDHEERSWRPPNRGLNPVDQHSPLPHRRELPRDSIPRRESVRDDGHRRREKHHVNRRARGVLKGPTAFQFAFDDTANEKELSDRPLGRQHNNTRASPDDTRL